MYQLVFRFDSLLILIDSFIYVYQQCIYLIDAYDALFMYNCVCVCLCVYLYMSTRKCHATLHSIYMILHPVCDVDMECIMMGFLVIVSARESPKTEGF